MLSDTSETKLSADRGQQNDWVIFWGSVAVLLVLVVPLLLDPEGGEVMLGQAFDYLTHEMGVFYILAGVCTLVFLLYLAFSRHGNIVFARDAHEAPAFSMFSWSGMLFCGGIGASVVYWGTIEWAHYYASPPFGIEPKSEEALIWAISYPIFHWGLIGWAFYCLPGIAMGYLYYCKGAQALRLSVACRRLIPVSLRPILNPVLDVIFVVGLVGACSTGVGLAVPLIGALMVEILGLPADSLGFGLDLIIIVFVTMLFSASAWLGLEYGIKRLSNFNVALAFFLIVAVFLLGPTLFISEMSLMTVGHLIENFVQMSFWTDPLEGADFVESWTVFYWAWWLALGPFMGVFIAKISRGRTIKQIVLGCLGYGTLGCALFFLVFGNFAAHLEINGIYSVTDAIANSSGQLAVVGVLSHLPMAGIFLFLFMVVCIVFAATSYDSASYAIATTIATNLPKDQDPGRVMRVFWAWFLGLLPIALLNIGGLRPLQSAVTLASVPLLIVFVLLGLSLWLSLKERT